MIQQALDLLVRLLARFEGCELVAYQDIGGIWTIGYGETLGVTKGMVWNHEQATAMLRSRAAYFLAQVIAQCPNLATQPEKAAACACLAYNIGKGAFYASSVRSLTKQARYTDAAERFILWNKVKGRVVRGLTLRRLQERNVYAT